jgi:acetyl esterase/lipase
MAGEVAEFTGLRGAYPRPSRLSVLAGHADRIRVYDEAHVRWCVQQFQDADPALGGEETLDAELAPGVALRPLTARAPPDDYNAGAGLVSAPGEPEGPVAVWAKTANTADGFGGLRGRSEWHVPAGCAREDCRVLFLHGGSYQWYSGVDQYYRPLLSRIAKESGMPVLAIDYRLAPEHQHPAPLRDGLDALAWMQRNGPSGPAPARKIFVAGDSSGGGLCLALMLAARHGLPSFGDEEEQEEGAAAAAGGWEPLQCDGAVAICPLTDVSYDYRRGGPLDGDDANSYLSRLFDPGDEAEGRGASGDPVFTATLGSLEADKLDRQEVIRTYAGHDRIHDEQLRDPLLSPVWATREELAGLAPCMLLAADEDLTVDDAVDFANHAHESGVEVDLVVWPKVWHDWVMCTEGRDMYGAKPGDASFSAEAQAQGFGAMKEATVALELVGIYLQALADRDGEPPTARL